MNPKRLIGPLGLLPLMLMSACVSGNGPLGIGPPTPAQILGAPSKAGLKDMHAKITGSNGGTGLTGDGTIILAPKSAIRMALTASTGLGPIAFEFISIDGKDYSRVGNAKFAVTDSKDTSKSGAWADGKNPKLVDEPTVNGDKTWHVKATNGSGDDFELWVREKDGYPLKYAGSGSQAFTMEFSEFNRGGTVAAPQSDQVTPPTKDAQGSVGQPLQLNGVNLTVATIQKNFVPDNQFERPKTGNSFIAVELIYQSTGSDKVSYNPFDWTVKDSSGAEYKTAYVSKEPQLHSGDLTKSGDKVRGWIVFELPTSASGFTLSAKIGNDTASVKF